MNNKAHITSIKTNLFLIFFNLFIMLAIVILYQLNLFQIHENLVLKAIFFCVFLFCGLFFVYVLLKFDKGVFDFKKNLINNIKDSVSAKLINSSVDKKYEIDRMQFVVDKTTYSKIHMTNVINFSDFSIGTGWGRSGYHGNSTKNDFLVWNFPSVKFHKSYHSYFVNRSVKYNLTSVFIVVILLDILSYFAALFYLDPLNASVITGLILLSLPVLLVCHLYFSLEHYLIPMGYFRHDLDALIYNKNHRFKLNFIECNSQGLTVVVNYISNFLTSTNEIEKSMILESNDVSEIHNLVRNYFLVSKK